MGCVESTCVDWASESTGIDKDPDVLHKEKHPKKFRKSPVIRPVEHKNSQNHNDTHSVSSSSSSSSSSIAAVAPSTASSTPCASASSTPRRTSLTYEECKPLAIHAEEALRVHLQMVSDAADGDDMRKSRLYKTLMSVIREDEAAKSGLQRTPSKCYSSSSSSSSQSDVLSTSEVLTRVPSNSTSSNISCVDDVCTSVITCLAECSVDHQRRLVWVCIDDTSVRQTTVSDGLLSGCLTAFMIFRITRGIREGYIPVVIDIPDLYTKIVLYATRSENGSRCKISV